MNERENFIYKLYLNDSISFYSGKTKWFCVDYANQFLYVLQRIWIWFSHTSVQSKIKENNKKVCADNKTREYYATSLEEAISLSSTSHYLTIYQSLSLPSLGTVTLHLSNKKGNFDLCVFRKRTKRARRYLGFSLSLPHEEKSTKHTTNALQQWMEKNENETQWQSKNREKNGLMRVQVKQQQRQ